MAEQTKNTDMSDEPDRQDLEDRVEQLESTIAKMLPSRRDALKLGGAALFGGAAMSGAAAAQAGTDDGEAGTIGTENAPVDVESQDIDATTVIANQVDAESVISGQTLTDNPGPATSPEVYRITQDGDIRNSDARTTITSDGTAQTIFVDVGALRGMYVVAGQRSGGHSFYDIVMAAPFNLVRIGGVTRGNVPTRNFAPVADPNKLTLSLNGNANTHEIAVSTTTFSSLI